MIISIGDKIRELRTNRGVHQKDICCETLNRTVLSKIENSKMLPSIPQLQYISNSFNVPISYFFETPSMLGDTVNNSDMDKLNLGCLFKQGKHLDILELYESN
jgi:transcriptional regulator with XRE-family HTH domain